MLPPTVQPAIPEVRCKQPAGRSVAPLPKEDEWVEWVPPKPGSNDRTGAARLSERGVSWILDVLGVVQQEKGLRKVEHDCLDNAERRKLIRQ